MHHGDNQPLFQEGKRPSANALNAMAQEIVRSSYAAGVGMHLGASGLQLKQSPDGGIFVRIDATDGGTPPKYSWTQVIRTEIGGIQVEPYPFTGTATNIPAYEYNNNPDVPLGTYVWLEFPDAYDRGVFFYPAAGEVGSPSTSSITHFVRVLSYTKNANGFYPARRCRFDDPNDLPDVEDCWVVDVNSAQLNVADWFLGRWVGEVDGLQAYVPETDRMFWAEITGGSQPYNFQEKYPTANNTFVLHPNGRVAATGYEITGNARVPVGSHVLMWPGQGEILGGNSVRYNYRFFYPDPNLGLLLGCNLFLNDDDDGALQVDGRVLAGAGLITDGSWCQLSVNPGCGVQIVDDAVTFDADSVAGAGLYVTGTCTLNAAVEAPITIINNYLTIQLETGGPFTIVNGALSLTTGCGLGVTAGVLKVHSADLAGPGLTLGSGCSLTPSLGCGLQFGPADTIAVDPTDLIGPGLGVGPGICNIMPVLGCGLEFDNDDQIAVNASDLVGPGLATGPGTCNLMVLLGCGLTRDNDDAITIDPNADCWGFLVTGSVGCGLYYDVEDANKLKVQTSDLVGPGLAQGSGCLITVSIGCGLKFDEADVITIDRTDLIGPGLTLGDDECNIKICLAEGSGLKFDAELDCLKVDLGKGLELDADGKIQPKVGPGLEFDGQGRLQPKIGDGLEFNEDGEIQPKVGPGLEIQGGQIQPKVGDGLEVDGYGDMVLDITVCNEIVTGVACVSGSLVVTTKYIRLPTGCSISSTPCT